MRWAGRNDGAVVAFVLGELQWQKLYHRGHREKREDTETLCGDGSVSAAVLCVLCVRSLEYRFGLVLHLGLLGGGFGGPRGDDAVDAGVGDGLAQVFVRVSDEQIDVV